MGHIFFICNNVVLSVASNCFGFEDSLPNQCQLVWMRKLLYHSSLFTFLLNSSLPFSLSVFLHFFHSFSFPIPPNSSLTIHSYVVHFVKGFENWVKFFLNCGIYDWGVVVSLDIGIMCENSTPWKHSDWIQSYQLIWIRRQIVVKNKESQDHVTEREIKMVEQ